MARLKDGVMQRGSTWSYVIRVTDPETNKSRPRWVGGFATEKDAKEARDDARVKARRREYVDRNRITVAKYLGEWLDGHEVEIKPQTMASYRDLVARYVVPKIGQLRLQGVQPAALTRLYRELRETGGRRGIGLSPRTVDYVHSVLRKAFNDAVRVDQILTSNPTDRAKRPRRVPAAAREVWTREQLLAFLESAQTHRLFPFFRLAAYSGARRGELLNLRWSDVDLEGAAIRIRGTAAVISGKRVEGTTKGGRARVVTLDRGTVKILATQRANQSRDRMLAGPDWSPGDFTFTRSLGLPLYPDTVSQLMPKLIKRHNKPVSSAPPLILLPHARLHDLRHVHATILLLAGVPVHVVADRLGHADAAITLRVYAHVLHDDAAKVADVFAQALGLPEGSV